MSQHRAAILLGAAVALLAPAAPAPAQEPTPLVVVETATARATPDVARVGATITRRARTARAARAGVERRVAEVLRRLGGVGVARADVRTDAINSFRFRRKGREQYVAQTRLALRTTDLDRLGRILRAFGGADLDGPEFEVSDPTAARQEATRVALERARRRADAAAAALGMRVLRIREIDLNPEFGYEGVQRASGQDESAATGDSRGGAPINVEPGRSEVAVAVAVIYEIGP